MSPWPALTERVDPVHGLDRWAAAEPALAGIGTAGELAETVHNGGDPARADELLGALVRLAAVDGGNEEDAALLVAHLLGNGTRKLALQLRDLSADIDDLLAGELWLQIRTFPWRRRRRAYAKSLLPIARACWTGRASIRTTRTSRACWTCWSGRSAPA